MKMKHKRMQSFIEHIRDAVREQNND